MFSQRTLLWFFSTDFCFVFKRKRKEKEKTWFASSVFFYAKQKQKKTISSLFFEMKQYKEKPL